MTNLIIPPTAVPCPDWCGEEPGHGYESETHEGRPVRNHDRHFGTSEIFAAVASEAVYGGGGELVEAGPWIDVRRPRQPDRRPRR